MLKNILKAPYFWDLQNLSESLHDFKYFATRKLTYEPVRHGPVHAAFFSFLANRVEHQKRTQTATRWWPFGFVFGVQLGLRHTQALINYLAQ